MYSSGELLREPRRQGAPRKTDRPDNPGLPYQGIGDSPDIYPSSLSQMILPVNVLWGTLSYESPGGSAIEGWVRRVFYREGPASPWGICWAYETGSVT